MSQQSARMTCGSWPSVNELSTFLPTCTCITTVRQNWILHLRDWSHSVGDHTSSLLSNARDSGFFLGHGGPEAALIYSLVVAESQTQRHRRRRRTSKSLKTILRPSVVPKKSTNSLWQTVPHAVWGGRARRLTRHRIPHPPHVATDMVQRRFLYKRVADDSLGIESRLHTDFSWCRFSALITPESLLLLTSRRPSKMCLAAQCCTALRKPMRILQLSSPSDTPVPRSTECTTILSTPKSVPTEGWIRVVLCQRVDFQRCWFLCIGQLWRSSAHFTIRVPKLFAYLDDWYLWIKPQCLLQTIAVITAATRSVNLALQSTKTQVRKGSCLDPIPPEFQTRSHSHSVAWRTSTNPWRHWAQPCFLGEQTIMEKTTQRFQKIATTLADLNAEGLNAQACERSTHHVCGCCKSTCPPHELCAWTRCSKLWQTGHVLLVPPYPTRRCFFYPSSLADLEWALQFNATRLPHGARGSRSSPRSWQQPSHRKQTLSSGQHHDNELNEHDFEPPSPYKWNKPTFQLKPLGAALRLKTIQKKQVSTIQRNIHKQFYNSLTDTPSEQAILLSQSTSHTGAHLMQPSSEAYEAEDRCFRVLRGQEIDASAPGRRQRCRCGTVLPEQKCGGCDL